MHRRRGVTTTEYMMLLSVLVVSIVAAAFIFVPAFKDGVLSLSSDVSAILSGESTNSNIPSGTQSTCPYVFDSRTGRWHEPDNYLMVSFSDAADAGC